jgi:hypothetical protein
MDYHNVAEIFARIQATRQQLYQRVKELSPTQANFKRAPDTWSVAEILEHLHKAEQYIVKRFNELLPAANPGNSSTVPVHFAPFSMDSYLETTRDRRLKSPESLVPAGGLPVSELLQKLRASRDELLTLRPRFEADDLSQIVGPHPAYGLINPYQALAGVGLHENRHLRQIEAIIASPGFSQA